MGILSGLFGKNEETVKTTIPEVTELLKLGNEMESLLDCSHYVAKSEYLDKLPVWQKTIDYFTVLKSSDMLASFCTRNNISQKAVNGIFFLTR